MLVGSGFDQENLDLMIGGAWTPSAFKCPAQREISGATQFTKPELRRNPDRKIDILAFMPDFDPGTAELAEARHFLP